MQQQKNLCHLKNWKNGMEKKNYKIWYIFSQAGVTEVRTGWFVGLKLKKSENSHNLNVWTPTLRDGEKRAVMVWLGMVSEVAHLPKIICMMGRI